MDGPFDLFSVCLLGMHSVRRPTDDLGHAGLIASPRLLLARWTAGARRWLHGACAATRRNFSNMTDIADEGKGRQARKDRPRY